MLRTLVIASVVALLLSAGVGRAEDPPYSGSLSYDTGGLVAMDGWQQPGTSMEWDVSLDAGGNYWNYQYTLYTPGQGQATSHFILEVSPLFALDDIWNIWVGNGTTQQEVTDPELNLYKPTSGPPNPHMPGDIFGIKFEEKLPDGDTLVVSFCSSRMPVWSDFYAVDGSPDDQGNYPAVWNADFGVDYSKYGPSNTPPGNKILAPDTDTGQGVTPELPPGALLLLTLIPAAWAGVRRKRS